MIIRLDSYNEERWKRALKLIEMISFTQKDVCHVCGHNCYSRFFIRELLVICWKQTFTVHRVIKIRVTMVNIMSESVSYIRELTHPYVIQLGVPVFLNFFKKSVPQKGKEQNNWSVRTLE